MNQLKQKAKRLCGDTIVFTGFRPDVKQVYRELDVAVHPSLSENLGGAAESMAAGVPTISTSIGGFPDIVRHDRTGLLVPPKDPEQLAKAILQILSNRVIARSMADKGRELVRKLLDLENTGNTVLNMYKKIIGGKAYERC